jgi:alpha-galactosidase
MKRRAFLSLAGAAGTLPLWPRPLAAQDAPAWRFDVDGRLLWRLARGGELAVADAAVTVELDGRTVLLTELDGVRRYRGGSREAGVWVVAGRYADTEISAEFLDDREYPAVTVRVRGLGEPRMVGAITLLDTARPTAVPALRAGGGMAWINGFESYSACRVVDVREVEATGHWQLALYGDGRTEPERERSEREVGARSRSDFGHRRTDGRMLAMSFGENDTGAGEFVIERGRLVARSMCRGRPVAAHLAPALTTFTLMPGEDPFAALGRFASFTVPRLPADVPSGWIAWPGASARMGEDELVRSLDVAAARFDRRAFQVVQLADGYQRSAGDWETNDRFPRGHRWITERIAAAGFRPGLWLAPFAVAESSGIPRTYPGWLLQDASGAPLVLEERAEWGGRIMGLDAEVDEAREHLRLLARHAVHHWGYEHLELDYLAHAARGPRPGRRWSPSETSRAGLRALKAGASGTFVVACGAPLQHSAGLADALRVGHDSAASEGAMRAGAAAALLRAHFHRRAWLNDPGALFAGEPLTTDEARMWATIVALSGGVAMATGLLDQLGDERLDIIQRVMPVLPVSGTALDLGATPAPAWMLAAAGDDRWMLAAFNWSSEEQRLTAPPIPRLRGTFASYDVWRESRGPDYAGRLTLTLPPHTCTCLALRRPRTAAPYVLGTTRHVVQGPAHLENESYDGRRRVLSGRSVGLDRRPHALTIAVPAGWHPAGCSGSVPCTIEHPHGPGRIGAGTARLMFGEAAERVEWEVRF